MRDEDDRIATARGVEKRGNDTRPGHRRARMPTTRRATRASARKRACDAESSPVTTPSDGRRAVTSSMASEDAREDDDEDCEVRVEGTPRTSGGEESPVTANDDGFEDAEDGDDAWGSMAESPGMGRPATQTPPVRVCARVAAIEEAAAKLEEGAEEDMDGLETPERKMTSARDDGDECEDEVNLGGTPEGADEDEEASQQEAAGSQTPLMSPVDRFRRSNVEPRSNMKPGGMWASIGSPMTAPFENKVLGNSIDAGATPSRPSAAAKKRAAMRMSLPANVVPMTPIPISRQVLERIECLGPSLNIVQRLMLVVGILLDFYSKTQLVRELHRFARAGSWLWFSMVLTFFVFSAACITGYWVLHYPMPKKPAKGSVGKDQKVFGFSKYDFKVVVRRFGAACAMLQLGTAFAAWRALRTNDVRARKAEMDLRGMQLVDTIFLTLPMATLQAYIGISCSSPTSVCPGREGFDMLLFLAVAGSITSGTLCFVSLDLHEKPPAYSWREYWKMHKAHLSEMMAKACYRFFELAARICTIGLFAAVTGPYVMLVFFFHACVILGLLKIRLPGTHDRKVWEKFCELREFKIWGLTWKLPVLDDVKLLVACLIWPPSSYVSNSTDRKGKFWWRSTSCPRKSFWGLTREDALIPFAVIIGVLAIEAGIMLIVVSLVAEEHYYSYLSIAVAVNFLWMISAVNWMSAAALWNPFVPEGPPLGYPSVSAINNAIGGRQLFSGLKKTPIKSPGASNNFVRSPAPFYRSPLEPVNENKLSVDLNTGAEAVDTPEFGHRKTDSNVSNTSSLGPRTTPVMIKGSPKPVEVYIDMGDDSADLNEDDEINPMVTEAIGEESMLRTSVQWRDSMELDRTASGDMDVAGSQDDLEAARQALNAVAALNTTGEYDGGCTPNVDMVSPLFVDKENSFNDTPEMADPYGDPYGVSPILANASPEQVRTSGGYSPR